MSILSAHRERVAALGAAMNELQGLHDQAFALWNRIVEVRRGNAPERHQQLDTLHDEAYALADRITSRREEAFGEISQEARLRLTASVESAQPLLNRPDVGLLVSE
jgi:hypothetical protein